MKIPVGIAGVTGYTGVELLRILGQHPDVELAMLCAGQNAGKKLRESWQGMGELGELDIEGVDTAALAARCKVVFLALPHGVSATVAQALLPSGVVVIDLGADFRLRDPAVYARAYGAHPCPELLPRAVYGLPEQQREALRGAQLVANPGCYPTATAIAALPIVEAGLADWLVADCISGISGAGRTANARNLYCEVQESVTAYSIAGSHRHTPEIEQILGVPVTFTPHLAPMRRGMLATVHARAKRPVTLPELRALFAARYADHPAVSLRESPPATAEVRGTARAAVHVAYDADRGVITAVCAIDNLGKGASGQAVHCMNLALGLPETAGLPLYPLLP